MTTYCFDSPPKWKHLVEPLIRGTNRNLNGISDHSHERYVESCHLMRDLYYTSLRTRNHYASKSQNSRPAMQSSSLHINPPPSSIVRIYSLQ